MEGVRQARKRGRAFQRIAGLVVQRYTKLGVLQKSKKARLAKIWPYLRW